jgi:hypothetical protein
MSRKKMDLDFSMSNAFVKPKTLGECAESSTQLDRQQSSRTNTNLPTDSDDIFHQKHLLLVEDNIVIQGFMLKMLRSLGFVRVDTAAGGL